MKETESEKNTKDPMRFSEEKNTDKNPMNEEELLEDVISIEANETFVPSSKSFLRTLMEFLCALIVSVIVSISLTWPAIGNY